MQLPFDWKITAERIPFHVSCLLLYLGEEDDGGGGGKVGTVALNNKKPSCSLFFTNKIDTKTNRDFLHYNMS